MLPQFAINDMQYGAHKCTTQAPLAMLLITGASGQRALQQEGSPGMHGRCSAHLRRPPAPPPTHTYTCVRMKLGGSMHMIHHDRSKQGQSEAYLPLQQTEAGGHRPGSRQILCHQKASPSTCSIEPGQQPPPSIHFANLPVYQCRGCLVSNTSGLLHHPGSAI